MTSPSTRGRWLLACLALVALLIPAFVYTFTFDGYVRPTWLALLPLYLALLLAACVARVVVMARATRGVEPVDDGRWPIAASYPSVAVGALIYLGFSACLGAIGPIVTAAHLLEHPTTTSTIDDRESPTSRVTFALADGSTVMPRITAAEEIDSDADYDEVVYDAHDPSRVMFAPDYVDGESAPFWATMLGFTVAVPVYAGAAYARWKRLDRRFGDGRPSSPIASVRESITHSARSGIETHRWKVRFADGANVIYADSPTARRRLLDRAAADGAEVRRKRRRRLG